MALHQISRRELIFMAASALPVISEAQTIDPESFELQVNNGVRLVNEWKRISQDKEGLWQKNFLFVSEVKYDVIKSESVLRPFIGTLKASILKAAGVKHPDKIDAEKELAIEDAPNVPGGKNAYVLEYDLKFESRAGGWPFLEGRVRDSLTGGGWSNIPVTLARSGEGVSGYVARSFATPVPRKRKTSPSVRTAPRNQT